MADIKTLEQKALSGDMEAITHAFVQLRQSGALIDEMSEALREFVEYDAEAEGDKSLADCDRIWQKAEIALSRADQYQNTTSSGERNDR